MNDILLQKILDLLRDGLAHVGNFFKDLFISDPQDGQVIGYDGATGEWKNMYVDDISLEVSKVTDTDNIISFSDASTEFHLISLKANINAAGGTDEVVITHTGKNLFNKTATDTTKGYISGYYLLSNGNPNQGSAWNISEYIKVNPNDKFVVSGISGNSPAICFYNSNKEYISGTPYNGSSSVAVTTPNDCFYVRISYNDSTIDTVQFEHGITATTYEPYNGINYPVLLPASVTSGYVDVITGKGMSGDSPFTVDPVLIKPIAGVNNIFADSGTVRAEYYTDTAGTIKDLVCITDDITSEITKNTTDFSDILLKVSQNNKVVSIEIYSASTSAAVNATFLSGLPKPAMNSKILLANTTLGEDGIILGTLKTSGELDITTSGAKSFSGLITYVAK